MIENNCFIFTFYFICSINTFLSSNVQEMNKNMFTVLLSMFEKLHNIVRKESKYVSEL